MLLGLVTPTTGSATINGRPHDRLGTPARAVGTVLENEGFHPSRTARDHLRVYTAAIGVPDQRADTLLGDPQMLVLDEPTNGLDPEGILWLRNFLRAYARERRTVLVSSHLLNEVEQTAAREPAFAGARAARGPGRAGEDVAGERVHAGSPTPDGRVAVAGASVRQIGDLAAKNGIAVYGMQEETADLERLFFQLTQPQYGGQPQPGHPQYPPQNRGGGCGWGTWSRRSSARRSRSTPGGCC